MCGISTKTEPSGLFTETQKRPDVKILSTNTLLDYSVTAPVSLVHPIPNNDNAFSYNVASKAAYDSKIRSYQRLADNADYNFIPIIFESTGRILPELQSMIHVTITNHLKGKQGECFNKIVVSKLKSYWYSRFSCCIQKSIADSIIRRAASINGGLLVGEGEVLNEIFMRDFNRSD